MTDAPLLEVQALRGGYGSVEVLRGVDLAVGSGEIVALLGTNGAGKSTLNNTVCGLYPAFAGRVRFAGADITRAASTQIVAAGLVQVPEGRRVFPNLTVRENLELGSYRRGRRERAASLERVHTVFPRLAERTRQRAGTLSGGEQQMLAIGRGLMACPRLLILDEPSLGLSPLLVEEMFGMLGRLHADGLAILLVEQNVAESLAVANRAYVMENGAIRFRGTPAELLARDDLKRAYLGLMIGLQTLAQKLVARAAGRQRVTPGEIVTCRVDLALMHDSGGPRRVQPLLARLGAQVWDPDRVVVVTDHYLPATDAESRRIVALARDWSAANGVSRFHDGIGICHVVLPEEGHLRPGMFVVGGDSHSPTAGAFGAYAFGVGATDMVGVLVTGEIWLRVPATILIEWSGRFSPGVAAKDAMLFLCARLGLDGGQYEAVEYTGDAVAALPMQERMTLANMTAELGGQTGLIAPDAITRDWLAEHGARDVDILTWHGDPGAPVRAHHRFDATELSPQVAMPHSPANAQPIEVCSGIPVTAAYIGACTGAKLTDLRMAARVLRGKRRAPGTRLMVAPASKRDQDAAAADGTLQILLDAGAELLPTACGACAGYGGHRFAATDVVISSTARNFRGRMGDAGASVYLGSPYTVAASAVAGRIADPRACL